LDLAFLNDFKIEAKELLDQIEDNVLKLETTSEWSPCINNIFQGLHSLKGASGMMGLDVLQEHMHRIEDVFEGIKKDKEKMKKNIDFFLKSVDHARDLIEGKSVRFSYTQEVASSNSPVIEKVKEVNEETITNTVAETVDDKLIDQAELIKLLDKSYHLLIYQFVDLDRYLAENNKDIVRNTLKKEIREIAITLEKYKARL